jgi:hypothetical protein
MRSVARYFRGPSARRLIFMISWTCCAVVAIIHNTRPHYLTRMDDFNTIRAALEAYRRDHLSFPMANTGSTSLGSNGTSNKKWIIGLVPQYLRTIPTDPLDSRMPNIQYLYLSDGTDYKIIAHGAEDAPFVVRAFPELADPARPAYAYGVWTPGAKKW